MIKRRTAIIPRSAVYLNLGCHIPTPPDQRVLIRDKPREGIIFHHQGKKTPDKWKITLNPILYHMGEGVGISPHSTPDFAGVVSFSGASSLAAERGEMAEEKEVKEIH